MSDYESIMLDAQMSEVIENIYAEKAFERAAIDQCIYLFVEGESEEIAFFHILQKRLSFDLEKNGIVLANYNGIGNIKHILRLMQQTLSFDRPMIVTFDDDLDGKNPKKVPLKNTLANNIHLFPIPQSPAVIFKDGSTGGSFEESFLPNDFISACFNTGLLKSHPRIKEKDFKLVFENSKPFYPQIIKFLKDQNLPTFEPSKTEIAFYMAKNCKEIPDTYIKLKELLESLRKKHPISPF